MADHFLGTAPIVSGNLVLPQIGAWTADILLEGTAAPTIGAQTTLTIRGRSRVGTVTHTSADYLQVKCRVVAGAGKLDVVVDPRNYRGVAASSIAQDALRDAGETPGSWGSLTTYCAAWQRAQGTCRAQLRRLSRLLGTDTYWRVKDDGTVDAVVDTYAPTTAAMTALGSWGQERLLLLGVLDSTIVPGVSVTAFGVQRRIEKVQYDFEAELFTAKCWYL